MNAVTVTVLQPPWSPVQDGSPEELYEYPNPIKLLQSTCRGRLGCSLPRSMVSACSANVFKNLLDNGAEWVI